ncbi:MAG: hypothetical protein HWQ44_16770 [Nostoc sp. JL34]|uniref:hypothetical protein n=1 Tax=Nostoc sp. JL34 TaxID=2815397 RepID=UPI001D630704|nr:hypothetical protein [Nostoc sp. JL34]MBN3884563.1 hypothetical protein [Nostoc sp. JL34]
MPISLPTRLEETLEPIPGLLAISLNEIQFDRYNFNPNEGAAIINYLQKSHLGIYLSQLEIVYSEVESFRTGVTDSQPIASINALQKLHSMLMQLTGIPSVVDLNVAMETLTKLGYEVKKKDV